MNTPGPAKPAGSADSILEDLRAVLVRRLWLAAVVVAAIGMPASLARIWFTGWQPAYAMHVAIAGTILGVQLAGSWLPPWVKRVIVIVNPILLGAIGVFGFAMLGNGVATLIVACVVTSLLFGARAMLLVAILSMAIVVAAGLLYVSGTLAVPYDANAYIRDPSSWVAVVFAVMLASIIVLVAMVHFQSSIVSLLREIERQRDVIAHQALHDPLTGLPQRRLAADRLEMALHAARRGHSSVALFYVDLDRFKAVNDRFGHEAGDCVLTAVADRLRQTTRDTDTVARLGGDEFLIILQGGAERDLLVARAQAALAAIALPIAHRDSSLSVGASIGIAHYPEDGEDAAELQRAADQAMYRAKQRGPGNFAFGERAAETAG
jgi:diguanylate cyclase (GGDEF)-like protein